MFTVKDSQLNAFGQQLQAAFLKREAFFYSLFVNPPALPTPPAPATVPEIVENCLGIVTVGMAGLQICSGIVHQQYSLRAILLNLGMAALWYLANRHNTQR